MQVFNVMARTGADPHQAGVLLYPRPLDVEAAAMTCSIDAVDAT